jgi:glycosyltransferase involved in cell wall biosynthesis
MKAAGKIQREHPDVIFLIAGDERSNYGHELHHTGGKSFKQFVLEKCDFDLSRFHFLGLIPTTDLLTLFRLSDVHFYLTGPFVLSWSMLQAMSTGCAMVGSATSPVQEVIEHEKNGLLADFYDWEGLADQSLRILRDPAGMQPLRDAARKTIEDRYALNLCLDELVGFFESQVANYKSQKGKIHQ